MYIELMEIDKNNNDIGEFIINTNDIIFVDTWNLDAGKCKRVKTRDEAGTYFYIRHADYNKIKGLLIPEQDTLKM